MMDGSLEKYIERLSGLQRKKSGLLKEILHLTEAQTSVITEEGIDELHRLVDEKQVRIDEITGLDEEFGVYFSRLKSSRRVSSLDELELSGVEGAKELKELTGEILKLITAISEIEKVNSVKSKALLDRFGSEIKKINQGKKANIAYAPVPMKAPSYFIDKKK